MVCLTLHTWGELMLDKKGGFTISCIKLKLFHEHVSRVYAMNSEYMPSLCQYIVFLNESQFIIT